MSCSFDNFDYGIDLTINKIVSFKGRLVPSGNKLDVQLKSSIRASTDDYNIRYSLEIDTYNTLRDEISPTRRILVLFLLPRDEKEWLEQDEDRLLMRKCAYWISLKGRQKVDNKTSVTIHIPRTNLFTVDALRDIMNNTNKELYRE